MNQVSPLNTFYRWGIAMAAASLLLQILFRAGHFFIHIIVLFGVTILLTYLMLAPVNFLEKQVQWLLYGLLDRLKLHAVKQKIPVLMPRVLSILGVYLLALIVLVVSSVRFLPVTSHQLYQFTRDMPHYVREMESQVFNSALTQRYFQQEIRMLQAQGVVPSPRTPAESQRMIALREKLYEDRLNLALQHLRTYGKAHITTIFENFYHLLSQTLLGLVYATTGLVLLFYFLLEGSNLKHGLVQLLPKPWHRDAEHFLTSLHEVMFGFTKGQVILGALTGVYLIIVNLLLGIPYAVFLGTFFAFAQVVPVVGPWVGFLPWILIMHAIPSSSIILLLLLFGVYMLIKDVWLGPKVMGHVMGLHPVVVILSLLVCAHGAGVAGLLFAIPLASMINVVLRFFQERSYGKRFRAR